MSTRLIHGHPSVPGQTEGRGPASTCSSLSPAHLNTWYNCLLSCLTKTSPPLTPLPYIQTESTVKSYQFILKSLPSAISFHLNFQHPGPSHHPFLPELLQQPPNWSCWFHFRPVNVILSEVNYPLLTVLSVTVTWGRGKKKPQMAH